MTLEPISILLGGAAGFAAAFLFMSARTAALKERLRHAEEAQARMGDAFSLAAQEALRKSSEDFLRLAQEKLKQAQSDGAHDLEKRQKAIADLVDPIGKTLKEMGQKVEHLGRAGAGLESQLKTFSEIQSRLRDETANLTRALRSPGQGGRWGEMHLQRTLESMGMVEGTHFRRQVQTTIDGARQQPDYVLSMPSGLHIVIDVKTPMDPFLEIANPDIGEDQRAATMHKFSKALRSHLEELSRKEYWRRFDSPDFVVMYLPSEGLFSMAVSANPQLLEDAAAKKIILASPTTMMGLLRVAYYGWQQQSIADEARRIAELGADLYHRVAIFGEHMQKLGGNLNTAMNTYNRAVGSLESKVLPGVKKFKELHIQTGAKEIPDLPPLEETPRSLSSPELLDDGAGEEDEQSKKRA
ncbi:MAG: DNA recombination protein RmuC [Proteobacteria bacterium]|nr:DNA recombination protein RmuC [Pseudomonadota bacterium]